jgi:hypothetical protein
MLTISTKKYDVNLMPPNSKEKILLINGVNKNEPKPQVRNLNLNINLKSQLSIAKEKILKSNTEKDRKGSYDNKTYKII